MGEIENTPTNTEEQKKSRRDSFRESFASRHPDIDMEDDEAYYGALDDEYNEREEQLKRYDEDNEKMNNMFAENPTAAYFVNDLMSGESNVAAALMRHFGSTFKEAIEDPTPENVTAFAQAMDEYAERIKENERLQEDFETNVDNSETVISDWAEQNNINAEQIDEIREYINKQFSNLVVGIITPEMLDFAAKGLNYDKDVATAEENGKVAGRNQRIKETMRKGKDDGVPAIIGGAKAGTTPRDEFLQNAYKKDPWEEAKREKY